MASTSQIASSLTPRRAKLTTREPSVIEEIEQRQREELQDRRQRMFAHKPSSFDQAPLSPSPLSPGASLPVIVRSVSHGRGLAQLAGRGTPASSRYEPVIAVARQSSVESSSGRKFSFDVPLVPVHAEATSAAQGDQSVDAARVTSWVESRGFPGKLAEKQPPRVSLGSMSVPLDTLSENPVENEMGRPKEDIIETGYEGEESSEDAFYLASEDVVSDEAYCSMVDRASLESAEKGLRRSTGTLSHSGSEEDGGKDLTRGSRVDDGLVKTVTTNENMSEPDGNRNTKLREESVIDENEEGSTSNVKTLSSHVDENKENTPTREACQDNRSSTMSTGLTAELTTWKNRVLMHSNADENAESNHVNESGDLLGSTTEDKFRCQNSSPEKSQLTETDLLVNEISDSSDEDLSQTSEDNDEVKHQESANLFECDPFKTNNQQEEIQLGELVDISDSEESSTIHKDQDEKADVCAAEGIQALNDTPGAVVMTSQAINGVDDQRKERDHGEVLTLELDKGVTGLGFCIQGGTDLGQGLSPITVKRLFSGDTDAQRLLKAEDEILVVGGTDLVGASHAHAWATLKALPPGIVKLTIRRST